MVCKKVFENWLKNEDTGSILVYYNGNSNLSIVRHTVRHTKSDQSKRSLTGSHVRGLSTYRVLHVLIKIVCCSHRARMDRGDPAEPTRSKSVATAWRTRIPFRTIAVYDLLNWGLLINLSLIHI